MEPRRAAAEPWTTPFRHALGQASSARPLIPPAPRGAMFFPLVVLVAVLPGLYAMSRWDLTPPGPWWGLRGLAVLRGLRVDQVPATADVGSTIESHAFRAVTLQPPLYAWLEALGLALSPHHNPLATVLPSYVAGVLSVLLVYWHGRLWRGPGLGLVAAVLTGFNRELLLHMQQATPATVGLAAMLAVLYAYIRHLQPAADMKGRWGGGGFHWALLGGAALGIALLAVGGVALVCVPAILLHQIFLATRSAPLERPSRWWLAARSSPTPVAGLISVLLGCTVAAPWFLFMYTRYGLEFLGSMAAPPDNGRDVRLGLLSSVVTLAPATAALAFFAAARIVCAAIRDKTEDPAPLGSVFWALWIAVASFSPLCWPGGPWASFELFLLVPLNLVAAQAIVDLARRAVSVRSLIGLIPATILAIAWWASADLREATLPLLYGRRPGPATVLGLHLWLDLLVFLALAVWTLVRWARRSDGRQRVVLAGFLATVLAITMIGGIREVRFRHRETRDLLSLRDVIIRLHQERPFTLVAVVGPDLPISPEIGPPGGRLRFVLRSALPEIPQVQVTRTDALLDLPSGQHLVILVGDQRLPYTLQAQLGLWTIHPGRSGVLDAFATHDSSQTLRR